MIRYSTICMKLLMAAFAFYAISKEDLSSLYKLEVYEKTLIFAYGFIALHGISGIIFWASEHPTHSLDCLYEFTLRLKDIFSFSLIVAFLCNKLGYDYGLVHIAIALAVFVNYVMDHYNVDMDILNGFNAISCAVISVSKEHYWGVACAFAYIVVILARHNEFFGVSKADRVTFCNIIFIILTQIAIYGTF